MGSVMRHIFQCFASSPQARFEGAVAECEAAVAKMKQAIRGYHKDEEDHWVAELVCGHNQHVRHHPPLVSRPWVMTEQGRDSMLGFELNCVKCDANMPVDNK